MKIKYNNLISYYNKFEIIKSITPVKNGNDHGIVLEYHENGELSTKMSYVDGKRHGYGIMYFNNGNLWIKTYFKNDKEFHFYDDEFKGGVR